MINLKKRFESEKLDKIFFDKKVNQANEQVSFLSKTIDDFRNYFRGLSVEDKLKNVPQGFEKDDKMAEFLKLKHFIVTHPVSDEQLLSKNAPKEIAKVYHAMKPLVDFLNAI